MHHTATPFDMPSSYSQSTTRIISSVLPSFVMSLFAKTARLPLPCAIFANYPCQQICVYIPLHICTYLFILVYTSTSLYTPLSRGSFIKEPIYPAPRPTPPPHTLCIPSTPTTLLAFVCVNLYSPLCSPLRLPALA